MATFLVERYWPGVTAVAAQAVTARLGIAAQAMTARPGVAAQAMTPKPGVAEQAMTARPGVGAQAVPPRLNRDGTPRAASTESTDPDSPSVGDRIVVVETIVTASDEVCFWYVEAESEDDITSAFKSAGIPIDRISPATALPDAPGS